MTWDVMLDLESEAPVFAELVSQGRARTAAKILDRIARDTADDEMRAWARRIHDLVVALSAPRAVAAPA